MWYRSRILSSCKRKSLMRPEDSQLRASCCFLHSFGITRLAPKSWKLKSTTSANSLNCLFSFSVDFVLICRATITVNGPVDAIYKNNGSCLVKVKDHLTALSLSLRCRNKNSKNVWVRTMLRSALLVIGHVLTTDVIGLVEKMVGGIQKHRLL